MTDSSLKILITGSNGFLGRHVVEELKRQDYLNLSLISGKKEYDLREQSAVRNVLLNTKPDWVIHLAGLVGGILANKEHPAQYFYDNLSMGIGLMHESWKSGVKKFLTCIGGCSYPAKAISPIVENALWDGYPQPESAPYSIAKKMMVVQAQSYRREYGFNSVVMVPGNMYGPFDNFDLYQSHVIPALIRKVVEAKKNNQPSIEMWGSGSPIRDFVYVEDVAKVLIYAMKNYDKSEIINISSGTGITIKELTSTVTDLVGYKGTIIWNSSKPDGQAVKIFDVSKLHAELNQNCPTSLTDGLKKTIEWYLQNRA